MRRLLLLLTLLSFHCAPAVSPRVAPPALSPTATAKRVVLLSFDGLGADALARQPNLPAFERLAREGASARVFPVDPTLTVPAHVSLLTGAVPQKHGIVANRFHLPGTPPERIQRGAAAEIEVETLVEAARRQGKRVGTIPFPTVDNASPRRTADFGVAWTAPMTPARLITLTRADFKREWVPPTWTARPQRRRSFSPIVRASVEWMAGSVRADVVIVAYDTTDDRAVNYDAFFVEHEEREIAPDARGWFPVSRMTTEGLAGSWSRILSATSTLDVTLYWGAVSRSNAWPASVRALLDERAGFWPGAPEEELNVDVATFTDQLERQAAFLTRAQLLAIERMPFDLLLGYQPQVDQSLHEYLGRPAGENAIRAALNAADRAVAAIAEALEAEDALIVTGDHGVVVTTIEVRLNTFLAEKGFAPRWRAFASGSHAHLYRSSGPDDSEALMDALTATKYFERIERKSDRSHRNSGDVIAWSYPQVALSPEPLAPAIVSTEPHGQHGALNVHRELHPPLFAIGTGVTAGNRGEIRQTEIARFVAGLLGIAAPVGAE